MKPKTFVAIVGALIILGGVVFGFVGHTVTYTGGVTPLQVSCGSAFSPGDAAEVPSIADQCSAARMPWLPWAAVGVGVFVLAGALVIRRETPSTASSAW